MFLIGEYLKRYPTSVSRLTSKILPTPYSRQDVYVGEYKVQSIDSSNVKVNERD